MYILIINKFCDKIRLYKKGEKMYKIIFFDLDGTLLNDNKEVLQESKEVIQKAKANGMEVVLCSGRQKNMVEPYRNSAEIGRYMICSNGAEIYDYANHEDLFTCEIDKDLCVDLYGLAKQKGYLLRIDTQYGRYINDIQFVWHNEIELTEEIETFSDKNKILQLTIGTQSEKEIDEIIENLKDNAYVKIENRYNIKINKNDFWLINIVNNSASKGNAIFGLCKYLKIDVKDAVAFGDDLNDISMMKTAGLGIAMENAHPQIKELAKKVIGNNNEPSIAECIEKIIEENDA